MQANYIVFAACNARASNAVKAFVPIATIL